MDLAQVLRPVAPPRLLDGVYTEDQYERLFGIVKQRGPWPTITAHHFTSVEELIATSSGIVPQDHGLTLDDIATAHFRGLFAEGMTCLYDEIRDCFYNQAFLDQVKGYWGAAYARPTMMLFNLCGPHRSGLNPHLDATTFRGIRYENSPVWLQNIMAKSGLFTDYLVKMAQVITWWYRGPRGTFTYWPDGPLEPPAHLDTPLWNRGVVVQNEVMFHRGDPVGDPQDRVIDGLKHRSMIEYRADGDDWAITTDGEVVRTYRAEQMRLLVHWSSEVFMDFDELKKSLDHTDDLTHERVIGALLADMRARGVAVAEPSDPLHDNDFIRALLTTYSIRPQTDWLTDAA